jgi:hypothetical protein
VSVSAHAGGGVFEWITKPGRSRETTNSYTLTPEGQRVAVFYTKLQARLLGPLLDADQPPAPLELRRALATISRATDDYIANARLGPAA